MSALIASTMRRHDVLPAIGPAILARLQMFGGGVGAHRPAAVNAKATLGVNCRFAVLLKIV